MCARSGDLDPSVVLYIMQKENLSPDEMNTILNKESGVFGISGISADFRDIEAEAANGNERAKLALKHYAYIVASFIAKYAVALDGIDVITFTAGVGENQINVRKSICDNLKFMGVKIDSKKNNVRSEEREISAEDSAIKIWIVPTNEELMIARDTLELIK